MANQVQNARELLKSIFMAGVGAVAPGAALLSHVSFDPHTRILSAGDQMYDTGKGRLYVVGAGKGAAPMAEAVENMLGARISHGFVVVKEGHELPLKHIEIAQASHPVPNSAGEMAAKRILSLAGDLGEEDLLICLITGGASALTPCPAHGLTLEQLRQTTELLLASGAHIGEINAIRKHLSSFSGGQLARAANGARVLSLIVSDVIGDDLAAIASGPTAPDPTTYGDCIAILEKYSIKGSLPPRALEILLAGHAGRLEETPKPGDPVFKRVNNIIIASNFQALQACAQLATKKGFTPVVQDKPVLGEAREAASRLLAQAAELSRQKGGKPKCLLAGGETTVTLKGKGLGGRNQEMALAAAIELNGRSGIYALFAGTDGSDGPTDAAGGFALPDSLARLGGRDKAMAMLETNDSNRALALSGDLFTTGPTLTNVMDLAIIWVDCN